jgi:hypothetical protein
LTPDWFIDGLQSWQSFMLYSISSETCLKNINQTDVENELRQKRLKLKKGRTEIERPLRQPIKKKTQKTPIFCM